MAKEIFPTTIVGSYSKPDYLNDAFKEYYAGKISHEQLHKLAEKAIVDVIKDHEEADVDIVSDGEMRRSEMTEFFAENIGGFKMFGPVRVWGNNYYQKPSIIEKMTYKKPILVDEYNYTKSLTKKRIKVPITGPYTIVDWSFNEAYRNKEEAIYALAEIENRELKALVKAGVDFIQIDEPALSTHPEEIEIARKAIEITTKGIDVKKGLHICYGEYDKIYPAVLDFNVDQIDLELANRKWDIDFLKEHEFTKEIGYGACDVHNPRVETVEEIVAGVRKGLELVSPEKLFVKPDCGLKMLPRNIAFEKLKVMVKAAKVLRKEFE
ncbi:Methionine synthase [Candidatus Gugararchaeum adminiculabundum]|nr:Methionine synthase [Candidatus Gugararchaeum adminiculabundum]